MCSKVLLAQEMYLRKIHTAGEEHCLPVQGRLHFELAVQKLISCFKLLEIGTWFFFVELQPAIHFVILIFFSFSLLFAGIMPQWLRSGIFIIKATVTHKKFTTLNIFTKMAMKSNTLKGLWWSISRAVTSARISTFSSMDFQDFDPFCGLFFSSTSITIGKFTR